MFGPKPRDFAKKVNASTRRLALRKALGERLKAGDVVVVDDLKLDSPKTKEFVGVLSALELKGSALIVLAGKDEVPEGKPKRTKKKAVSDDAAARNLTLASRNVPNVAVKTSDSLNTYDVLRPDKLVFTRGAFEKIEARLAKE